MATRVRKQRGINTDVYESLLSPDSVQDPSLREGVTHMQGGSSISLKGCSTPASFRVFKVDILPFHAGSSHETQDPGPPLIRLADSHVLIPTASVTGRDWQ